MVINSNTEKSNETHIWVLFCKACDNLSPNFQNKGSSGSHQTYHLFLKVVGKSVGLCKTTKRKDQLYITLLISAYRIICENFKPNGLIAEI